MQSSLNNQITFIDDHKRYIKLTPIGSGNFGTVYKGFDNLKRQLVALKYIPNCNVQSWEKEVKVLSILNHTNVIKYEDFVLQKTANQQITGIYIITEYFRGFTLSHYIKENTKIQEIGLSQISILQIFSQLLEGFEYIHKMKIVHRDVKPENILIGQHQQVKIIDFGKSKQQNLLQTRTLGTPLYAAPQAFKENISDFRRDVWSLGMVLYQMITGKCYFQSFLGCQDSKIFQKHLKDVKIKIDLPKSFHPFWGRLLKKMLEKDFKLRPYIHEIILELNQKKAQLYRHFKQKGLDRNLKQQIKKKNIVTGDQLQKINPLKQSQSEFELSRTKRYLLFFKQKYSFLVLLGDLLRKYHYPFLSNAHKLILVFVSLNIYTASIEHLLRRFDQDRIIITENQKFDASEFEQPYHSDMKQYLKYYRKYFEIELRITRDTILQKIIPKFSPLGNLGKIIGQQKKPIDPSQLLESQQYRGMKELIEDFKRGKNYDKNSYIKIFKTLIYSQDYYHNQQNIRRFFYEQDMVIYYLFMIICHIDDFIHWKRQFAGDQLSKLREQLNSKHRSQQQIEKLIKKISKYNNVVNKQ